MKKTSFALADKRGYYGGDWGTRTLDLMRVKHAL